MHKIIVKYYLKVYMLLTVLSVAVRAGASVVYRGSGHRLWEMGLRWRWTGGCRMWWGKKPLL